MKPRVSAITLGVNDFPRARKFYADLGWPIAQDYGEWVAFALADGTSLFGLFPWDAAAAEAGVSAEGSGFRGVVFSYIVRTEERVAEVLAEAERAGGKIVKPAVPAQWGGATGFFADPEGYLWKVASGSGPQPFAE